jgi:hypothetical protein
MGNSFSNNTNTNLKTINNNSKANANAKVETSAEVIDFIATYYILTMDFKSLRKLYDKQYCNKLAIITSDIIEKYFTDMEIGYLANRIYPASNSNSNSNTKQRIMFFNKDQLDKLDMIDQDKKQEICLEISKFYVKIAHIFAAIVTTINPVYVYKDATGEKVKVHLDEKDSIPQGTDFDIYKLNICDTRKSALERGYKTDDPNKNVINPRVCSMNTNNDGSVKTLDEEPGIMELMDLYYDTDYNSENGEFEEMSQESKDMYLHDLKMFYTVFTGNEVMPPEVKQFKDIKLREYLSSDKCKGSNPLFERAVFGSVNEEPLFAQYAENLREMIDKANEGQNVLLGILNKIFVYSVDSETNKKQIRINPKINDNNIQDLVIETRAAIIKLYLTCEADYDNGIQIYEAIIEKMILKTTENQIKTLTEKKERLFNGDRIETKSIPKSAEEIKLSSKQ